MRPLKCHTVILVLSLAFASAVAIPAGAEQRGPDLVTVIGAVGETNRPAFSDFEDGFFAYHEQRFETAFAFDRAALEALPQVTATARAEGWPAPVTASGPRLGELLRVAGVDPAAPITLMALDGYGVSLTAEERAARDWVLAISADGRALGLGGRGPVWLLYDTGGETVSHEAEAQWVWSVFVISVE